ncbi:MAG: ATP-binding cassette domain-containing protein, partial [Bacilli bacterium]|nr:ATP-binding cassette domain-containing protein [Bacilli bacterium]
KVFMEEKKEVRNFKFSTLFFMIRCIFRASPILFPLLIILTILSIGLSAFALFVLRDATNALVDMLNLDATLTKVFILVFLYLFIEIVFDQFIRFIINYTEGHYYKQADRYFRVLLLYKLGKLPQVNMYDSNIYNKYEYTYTYLYMFQQLPWYLIQFAIHFSFSKLLYLGIIFAFNWVAGIYCLILFIINIIASLLITNKQAKVDKENILPTRQKDYYGSLLNTKAYIKETKINRLEGYFFKKFKDLYLFIRDRYFKIIYQETLVNQIISILSFLFNNGLIFLLIYMVYQGKINLGELTLIQSAGMSLVYAAGQFRRPTKYIVQFVKYAPTMIAMLYPLSKEERKEMKERDYPDFSLKLGDFENIVLKNVTFSYPSKEDEAVSGINLKITRGEIISILGYNGSGKTTLCKLVAGILTPSSGKVYFNGQNIAALDKNEYYKYFGIGFQDYAKYSLRLRDNIGFGRIEALDNDEALNAAIGKTNLQNIIDKLPLGVETILGKEYDKDGQDLSVGQWQRVILARAYMGSPEILILDEPTASIDPFEEERMLEEFRDALEYKTAILISHRISFARLADRIVMMRDGMIVETGTHEELLRNKGYYYELFSSQQALYQSEVGGDEN